MVMLMGAVGLSALTPYLDLALLPALGIMIVLAILSYLRWRKAAQKQSKCRYVDNIGSKYHGAKK
nr:mercury resistance system transport protein MerF [Desulfosarcina widdelii]